MAEFRLGKLNLLGLALVLLSLTTACTREIGKPSHISLRLPGDSNSFSSKTNSNVSTNSIGVMKPGDISWALNDPSIITDVGCYAILIEGSNPGGTVQTCTTLGNITVASPWLSSGAYVAGSTIEISVPSGAGRKINLVGFRASTAAACGNLQTIGPNRSLLSAPQIIGSTTVDLAPNGRTEVNINASLSGAVKFEDCGSWKSMPSTLPAISVADVSVSEGGTFARLTVTLSAASAVPVQFELTTAAGGTAQYGPDYPTYMVPGTISVGARYLFLDFPITDDAAFEPNETVYLTLEVPGGEAGVADTTAIVTIVNNDSAPVASIYSTSVVEGQSAYLTVSLSQSSGQVTYLNYATAAGTAAAGTDFVASSGLISILPGNTNGQILINTVNDGNTESNEFFTVSISNFNGATGGAVVASATILDDDSATPFIYINNVTLLESTGGNFLVSLSGAAASDVTFTLVSSANTATYGLDYFTTSWNGTISAGNLSTNILINLVDDSMYESTEFFTVSLTSVVNANIVAPTAQVSIADNESPPNITLETSAVNENGAFATFIVSLSAISGRDVFYDYATNDNTATVGTDYTFTSGTATLAAGSQTTLILVPIIDDNIYEIPQTFTLNLFNITNTVETSVPSGITILDNEPIPQVSIMDAAAVEPGSANFVVTMSGPAEVSTSLDYVTSNGTATTSADYTFTAGTLTFTPGQQSRTISVPILDDVLNEVAEDFVVSLSNPSFVTLVDNIAVGTIAANDSAVINIADASYVESASSMIFNVRLDLPAVSNVFFNYQTFSGTAAPGSDFTAASGSASILSGLTITTITVPLINDSIFEGNETLLVSLSSVTNADEGDLVATGTIIDDESAPLLYVQSINVTEGTSALMVVSMSTASAMPVTFNYTTTAGNATAGSDFISQTGVGTLTSGMMSITILTSTTDDSNIESDETFSLVISGPVNAAVGIGTGVITLKDNDGWIQQAFIKTSNQAVAHSMGKVIQVHGDYMVAGVYPESASDTQVLLGTLASGNTSAPAAGAAYIFGRAGASWSQRAYLKAPNADSGDQFGITSVIYDDIVAVGAIGESSSQTSITNGSSASANNALSSSGAVYIFKRNGFSWAQEAYIKASNADATDNFGSTLALDGATLVVGVQSEDSNQSTVTNGSVSSGSNTTAQAGAAYVYVRGAGGTWSQQAYLKSPNPDANDNFGSSIAVNQDTIVVATPQEDSSVTGVLNGTLASANNAATDSGAAYIFKRTAGTWVMQSFVKAPNAGSMDYFGNSVALHGDTLIVGAMGEASASTLIANGTTGSADNSAASAGATYVFKRSGNAWASEAYLKPSNNKSAQFFGAAVSLWGNSAVVGAYEESSSSQMVVNGTGAANDTTAAQAGAAYVFKRIANTWYQEAYLKAANAGVGDYYGSGVSIDGDTIVVGAPSEDSLVGGVTNGTTATSNDSSNDSGAAYIYGSTGPLNVIVTQHKAQPDPSVGFPITFSVQFSRAINPSTFLAADISQTGTATGLAWGAPTNPSGDNKNFEITVNSGVSGTVVPTMAAGVVSDTLGTTNQTSLPGYDASVTIP